MTESGAKVTEPRMTLPERTEEAFCNPVSNVTRLGNDDIKWETTTQTNLGLDFSFFNQSLYGSFDWYWKKTTDILVQMAGIAAWVREVRNGLMPERWRTKGLN